MITSDEFSDVWSNTHLSLSEESHFANSFIYADDDLDFLGEVTSSNIEDIKETNPEYFI